LAPSSRPSEHSERQSPPRTNCAVLDAGKPDPADCRLMRLRGAVPGPFASRGNPNTGRFDAALPPGPALAGYFERNGAPCALARLRRGVSHASLVVVVLGLRRGVGASRPVGGAATKTGPGGPNGTLPLPPPAGTGGVRRTVQLP